MFRENCRDWLTGVGVDYLVNTRCGKGQEPPRPWAFLPYHSLIEASTTARGEGKGWSTHRAATFPHPHHGLANPTASERRGWSPTVLWVKKEKTLLFLLLRSPFPSEETGAIVSPYLLVISCWEGRRKVSLYRDLYILHEQEKPFLVNNDFLSYFVITASSSIQVLQ